jgi:PKD repeat protein
LSLSIKLGDAGHARRHKLLAMLVLSFALTAGSIICATPIFAQNIVSGPTSLPGLDASGSTAASDGAATTVQPSSQLTPGEANQAPLNAGLPAQPSSAATNQAPLNAELLAQPTYGTAPLTVDFAVIIASSAGSLTYQWNFGDGAVSSLPFAAYFPHVYQRPGTYWCYLTLTGAGGRSATVFTPVIVLPRQS